MTTLLAVFLLGIGLRSSPVRYLVRLAVEALASGQTGTVVSIGELDYVISTLTITAGDITVAPRRPEGVVRNGASRTALQRLSATRGVAVLAWRDLIRGRFTPRRVTVSGVTIAVDIGGTGVELRHVAADATVADAGRMAAEIRRDGSTTLRVADTTVPLAILDASLALDRAALIIRRLQVSSPAMDLEASGRLVDVRTVPRLALNGTTSLRSPEACETMPALAPFCAIAHASTLEATFGVTGALSEMSLAIPRAEMPLVGGVVGVRDVNVELSSLRLRGRVLWQNLVAEDLARATGVVLPFGLTTDGEATLHGNPMVPAQLTVDGRAAMRTTSGFVPGGCQLAFRLDAGRWVSRASGRFGVTTFESALSGSLPPGGTRWAAAPMTGTVTVVSPDLRQTLVTARRLRLVREFPTVPPGWDGRGQVVVKLAGSVEAPVAGISARMEVLPGDQVPIDAIAELRLTKALVDVQSLRISRADDTVEGTGSWSPRSGSISGEFSGHVADLRALASIADIGRIPLARGLTTGGRVSGTISRPNLDATVRAADVRIPAGGGGEIAVGPVDATVGMFERIELRAEAPEARVTATAIVERSRRAPFIAVVQIADGDVGPVASVLAPEREIAARVDATLVVSGVAATPRDAEMVLDVERLVGSVDGLPVSLNRPAHARAAVGAITDAAIDARVVEMLVRLSREPESDAWHVTASGPVPVRVDDLPEPVVVTLDALVTRSTLSVRHAAAASGMTTAELQGEVPLRFANRWLPASLQVTDEDAGIGQAELRVKGLSIGAVAHRVAPDSANLVDGSLDLVVSASAARPSLDAVTADGRIESGQVRTAGITFTQAGAAAFALRDGIASLEDWRWAAPGTDLTLNGRSTIQEGELWFDASAVGEVDLGATFGTAADRVAGRATLDVQTHGDASGLTWTGSLVVREGAWVARQKGVALTDADVRVSCEATRCDVDEFTGRLNGGTVSVTGEVPISATAGGVLSGGTLAMSVRGAGIEFPKGTRHDIDADLALAGTDPPRLAGTVTIWPGAVTESIVSLIGELRSLPKGQPDVATGAAPARLSQLPLDIRIVSGDALTFDSHDLQVTATADLRVRGTLANPQLRGTVAALDQGHVFLGGRMWDLEEGAVTVGAGVDGTETRVAATLSAKISKYSVSIGVSGPVNQPSLAMTSDPPLGQSDLADLVLTGRISGNAARAGGQQVATMVSGELLSSAGRTVGIDAVRIEQNQSELSTADLEPVARLTISKRLTGRSEIVYSQGLSDSDDQAWVIVYRPGWQSLDLRATVRTNGAEAYELRQELEFGAPQRQAAERQRQHSAPVVARIEIEGLTADESVAIRRLMALRPGSEFSNAKWQRDRQKVTRYFHERDRLAVRVRASHTLTEGGSYLLVYRITPGPITRLEIRGYTFPDKTIDTLRDVWARTVVEDLLAADLTEVVRLQLAARRYLMAEVRTSFQPLEESGRLAVIDVTPGSRVKHRQFVFSGNTAVKEADLRQVLKDRRLEPRCWLEPAIVEAPVVAAYRSRGYLSARATVVRTIEGARATLTVTVDEGRLFTVGAVSVSGAAALGEARARAGLALTEGAAFTSDTLTTALSRLRTTYARAGYLDADVSTTTQIVPDRSVVDVALAIDEGVPSMLEDVRLTGRRETSERLVSRAFGVQPGGPVDSVALDEAQQRLYRTGIFRTVDVDVAPTSEVAAGAPQPVRATVAMEERAKYRVRYGVQFGPSTIDSITTATDTAEPGATFDLQRRNLFGVGLVGGVGGVWSASQHRVRGTLSAATLRGRFVSTTFTIEQANQDREWSDSQLEGPAFPVTLQVIDRSLRAILEQRWRYGVSKRVELAYGFEIDHRRLELQATSDVLPLRANLADLNATVTYDTRDNRLNPKVGLFHSSRIEVGAGGWFSDLPFARYQLQQYIYRPVGAATFASGVRFGTLDINQQRNPTSLLLFFRTGGATSVRGYETDSLTPAYVIGVPAGGKVLLVLNEELRIPLKKRLGLVTFVDAGNTFTGIDAFRFGDLKVGAGVGLRLDTPVAVLRLDLALPLPRQPGGPRQRWYLSIGQAF